MINAIGMCSSFSNYVEILYRDITYILHGLQIVLQYVTLFKRNNRTVLRSAV